jgi:hypothetical protein
MTALLPRVPRERAPLPRGKTLARHVAGIAIATAALFGCASARQTNALPQLAPPALEPESACLRLGPIAGTADPFFGGLMSEEVLVESARHDALVQGQRAGATHVQLSDDVRRWPSGMFGGGQGVTVVGVAYNCSSLKAVPHAPAAVPTVAGCTKDTDCKGERICVAGACADPPRRPVPVSTQCEATMPVRDGGAVDPDDLLAALLPSFDRTSHTTIVRTVEALDGGRDSLVARDCLHVDRPVGAPPPSSWRASDRVEPAVLATASADEGRVVAWVRLGQHEGYCAGPVGVLALFSVAEGRVRLVAAESQDLECAMDPKLREVAHGSGQRLLVTVKGNGSEGSSQELERVWRVDGTGLHALGEYATVGRQGRDQGDVTEVDATVEYGMQRIIVREVERKKTCSAADSCKTLSQKARTTRYRVGSTLERE